MAVPCTVSAIEAGSRAATSRLHVCRWQDTPPISACGWPVSAASGGVTPLRAVVTPPALLAWMMQTIREPAALAGGMKTLLEPLWKTCGVVASLWKV